MIRCMVCDELFEGEEFLKLADHLYTLTEVSDPSHISWLNRNLTSQKVKPRNLASLLQDYFDIGELGLKKWVKLRFIEKFYGTPAHPFVEALQHPSRATLLGYVVEHQHFLRQWVRSCAYIMAKTEFDDVVLYELDNINTEFGGYQGSEAHYQLLLKMGESLGFTKEKIISMKPLAETEKSIKLWSHIAATYHWLETMLAMHGLELIAHKGLRGDGAVKHYFDPEILETNEVTEATKAFLREGYEADVQHVEEALDLIEKYTSTSKSQYLRAAQSTFLKSIEAFDKYLTSRLKRAEQFEG
ncbi:MAG: iron-containing redox enzyme family protein [Candidatus Heimdallarchaeota archaeon]